MTYKIEIVSIDKLDATTTTDITSLVDIGFSTYEKLDEALDTGSLTISNDLSNIDFKMFDIVDIKIDDVIIYSFRIGGVNTSITGKNPLVYSHTLSLVEHTKILEREIISGFTLTQPLEDGETKYTLLDTVNQIKNTYPLEISSLYITTRIFNVDSTLATYLDSIESPEFTFKDITIREALNQIAGYVDAVCRLDRESTLTFDFFNDLVNIISDETGIIEKIIQQNIDSYATDITVDAINMVNDSDYNDGVEIYPSDSVFTTHRTNDFILSPSNMFIPTNKNIYRVRKCIWKGDIDISNNALLNYFPSLLPISGEYEVDITERVYEFKAYQTHPLDKEDDLFNLGGTVYDERRNPDNILKSNTIYYNYREKNIIDNMTTGLWDTKLSVDFAIKASVYTQLVNDGTITDTANGWASLDITINSTELEYLWKIEYETIPSSIRMNISRDDNTDVSYKSSIISNQQSRIVKISSFAENTGGIINRIGNKDLELSNRVVSISDAYNIGDYTSDLFIITTKELIFYNDFIYCKYGLSRNFNRISQFIGVNSEERQYEIAEKDRTLERDLLYKEFIYVDALQNGSGSNDSETLETLGIESYLDTFNTISTKPTCNVGVCKPYDSGGNRIGSTFNYEGNIANSYGTLTPTTLNGAGKNIIINFEFDSNKNAGNWTNNKNTVAGVVNQYANDYAPYTDENGELTRLEIEIFEDMSAPTSLSNAVRLGETLPYINTTPTNKMIDYTMYVLKDRRSRLKGTLQYEHKPVDSSKVIIGKNLTKRNRLINENTPSEIRLYTYSNGFEFGRYDNDILPSGYDTTTSYVIAPTVSYSNFNVVITNARLTAFVDSYCLTDENEKILLAVNQGGKKLDTITFDFMNKDTNVNYKYYN